MKNFLFLLTAMAASAMATTAFADGNQVTMNEQHGNQGHNEGVPDFVLKTIRVPRKGAKLGHVTQASKCLEEEHCGFICFRNLNY